MTERNKMMLAEAHKAIDRLFEEVSHTPSTGQYAVRAHVSAGIVTRIEREIKDQIDIPKVGNGQKSA